MGSKICGPTENPDEKVTFPERTQYQYAGREQNDTCGLLRCQLGHNYPPDYIGIPESHRIIVRDSKLPFF